MCSPSKETTLCFDTDEALQNAQNEIKEYVIVVEKKGPEGLLPKQKQGVDLADPIVKFPGYVDRRHPALKPSNPKDPSAKVKSENKADPYIVVRPCMEQKPFKKLKKSKSQELRGGILYVGCSCSKRNGLQDDCRRRECGHKPECLSSDPGPCCGPALSPKPT